MSEPDRSIQHTSSSTSDDNLRLEDSVQQSSGHKKSSEDVVESPSSPFPTKEGPSHKEEEIFKHNNNESEIIGSLEEEQIGNLDVTQGVQDAHHNLNEPEIGQNTYFVEYLEDNKSLDPQGSTMKQLDEKDVDDIGGTPLRVEKDLGSNGMQAYLPYTHRSNK